MAGLKAAILALALSTASCFQQAPQTGAARGRPSLKSYWRRPLKRCRRVDAVARHHFAS
jgi:hypothetical protein